MTHYLTSILDTHDIKKHFSTRTSDDSLKTVFFFGSTEFTFLYLTFWPRRERESIREKWLINTKC